MQRDPIDEFEAVEHMEYLGSIRARERKRESQNRKAQKKRAATAAAEMRLKEDGPPDPALRFETTYRPRRFEEGWMMNSLNGFYEDGLIIDVLAEVKGGKEANVYLCQAAPEVGPELVAAKVYRPRRFRNLRNDAMYREGREILSDEGGIVRRNDSRAMRAMKNKTRLGAQMLHQSWILYEFGTLQRLHSLDVPVPKPLSCGENAILMEFVGDANTAAPVLHSVRLQPEEAKPLFEKTVASIEVMLSEGLIHGDLSSYNILYWEGDITLIDFPQVTPAHTNSRGYEIFARDVLRVCEYFQKQGVESDPVEIAEILWREHLGREFEGRIVE